MILLERLRELFSETTGAGFRISPDVEHGWTLYLPATKTIFKGTLEEIAQAAYEEILSYRTLRSDFKHVHKKNQKPYDYR